MIEPLPTTSSQAKHAVMAINYFTWWVEAKSLAQITEANTTSFVMENIVYRFGTPMAIIIDLELPKVLWAYRTTKRTATGETPYSLAFKIEAVSPIEHRLTSFNVQHFELEDSETKLRASLGLLEEKQHRAAERVAAYQSKIARCFNRNVKT
ncbi:hypothetical protein LWI29_007232 [Acer saccharum]|uniref:Uncharacterized protein n=1 Tax=Acer saccharum TaxID=4024 RepID=A0AA39VAM8_ACESA|nr:hypothetical protein LWI29_007232 [Acer saccharum]